MVPPATIPPLKFQFPVSAGSVAGPEITTTTEVGAGVGTVVAGVGTGAGVVVHPAARMPTNKTAQTKNSKDFIAQNILIFYKYVSLRCRDKANIFISRLITKILIDNQDKK
jgi:hypothetical protein